METKVFAPAQFVMDAFDGTFNGYTDGSTWNGWACPCFELKVAKDVLKASEANGYSWNLDEERDVFLVRSSEDPPEYEAAEFWGSDILVNGRTIHVYAVGAHSWIWEEFAEE